MELFSIRIQRTFQLVSTSQGHYKQNSEAISEIRKEILEKDRNRNDDKRNLMEDRKNIEGDVRRSFNEIALKNG